MKPKLIILHGLPGSGKSTFTENYIHENPKEKIVIANRDTIREKLFGKSYHEKFNSMTFEERAKFESQVTKVHHGIIHNALENNQTVIDDNTNLNTKGLKNLLKIAKKYDAEVSNKTMDVSIEEAKKRNRKRASEGGRFVPEEVIDRMATSCYADGKIGDFQLKYENGSYGIRLIPGSTINSKKVDALNEKLLAKNPLNGKAVVIVDCDATLFNNEKDSARFLESPGKKDFVSFYKGIKKAPVNKEVLELTDKMRADGLNIIVMTGRTDKYADDLISAIKRSGVQASRLIVKRDLDYRPSSIFKKESLETLRKEGLIPVHAIDDRETDLKMFADEGITTTVVERMGLTYNDYDDTNKKPILKVNYSGGSCVRCGSKLKDPNKTIGDACRRKMTL